MFFHFGLSFSQTHRKDHKDYPNFNLWCYYFYLVLSFNDLSINNCKLKITQLLIAVFLHTHADTHAHTHTCTEYRAFKTLWQSQHSIQDKIINYRINYRCSVYTGHLATLPTKRVISLIRQLPCPMPSFPKANTL